MGPGYSDLPESLITTDAWVNPFSGYGTDRDKSTWGTFAPEPPLPDMALAALYHHDDMAGKVVALLPQEALRQGVELTGPDVQAFRARFESYDTEQYLLDALVFGRAFGGAVLYLGANDGRAAIDPLIESQVRSFDFLDLYDKRRAFPIAWYENPREVRYGRPRIYQLISLRGGSSEVHESRLMRFGGAHTADQERYQLQWWDYSILQRCHEAIRAFNTASKSVELMLTEASQFVFSIAGLISAIAGGLNGSGFRDLQTRMALLDMSKSVARAIMIDPAHGEKAERLAMSFAGVGDAWDRVAVRLSAAAECPVTVLLGRSPAGMNATGDSDIRLWYDRIESYRRRTIKPRLDRLIRLMRLGWGVKTPVESTFPSLWQESPLESATRRKTVADIDLIYLQNEVVSPETVAASRWGSGTWSPEMTLPAPATPLPRPLTPGPGKMPAPPYPAPVVARQAKPGQGRLPVPRGPTTGDPWPDGRTE